MVLTQGTEAISKAARLSTLKQEKTILVFDEIHKYRKWKSLLKGFFDTYSQQCKILVTGSARMTVYQPGGDSLMGRYFLYRMHPLSVSELASRQMREREIKQPAKPDSHAITQLLRFGGFPEPFLNGTTRFYNRWNKLRAHQLFNEDLRDLSRIHETGQVQVLARLLADQVGQGLNYHTMAQQVNVSVDTIKRWIATLEALYYCFTIRPWFRNIPKSLRKQPKAFLWDWSMVKDKGSRNENFIASHLLKAVQYWTDAGLGDYALYYLRDKSKKEVDFLVTRDDNPWFMVECKTSTKRDINPALAYFQHVIKAQHAFQVVFDLDYVDRDCFEIKTPVRVPVSTFLSQLV